MPSRSTWAKSDVRMLLHAKRRLWERYLLDLTIPQLQELVCDIQQDRSTPIGRSNRYRTWHIVYWQERPLLAVYDKQAKAIVSFLEPNWIRSAPKRLTKVTRMGKAAIRAYNNDLRLPPMLSYTLAPELNHR